MTAAPPATFISLYEAFSRRDDHPFNIIGVCTNVLPPFKSRGSDYTMKINLWDESCQGVNELDRDGLCIRPFARQLDQLPVIERTSDVLLLRDVKLKPYGSQWVTVTNFETAWTVITREALTNSVDDEQLHATSYKSGTRTGKLVPQPTIEELKYAQRILYSKNPDPLEVSSGFTDSDAANAAMGNAMVAPPVRIKQKLFCELSDPSTLRGHQFADLLGEICKVYDSGNSVVEIRISDYTEHPLLRDYPRPGHGRDGDEFGYVVPKEVHAGPYGRRVMTVMAWDEHGQYLKDLMSGNQIKLGMYITIRNVHIKMGRDGVQLEGHLRSGGSSFGNSMTLHRAKDAEVDDRIKALLERKREYARTEILNTPQFDPVPKRKAENMEGVVDKTAPKKSRRARLRQAKKEREQAEASRVAKLPSNQNVKTQALDIPLTSVAQILDTQKLARQTPAGNPYHVPFQNSKYKARVQVVDFFPDNIEDFATPYKTSVHEVLEGYDTADDEEAPLEFARSHTEAVRWKWHFILFVQDPSISSAEKEDAKDTMLLQIHRKSGEHLLNMDACDLRNDSKALARLKEKLFVLWGDLAERKAINSTEGKNGSVDIIKASSVPFECFVEEYGVLAQDFEGRPIKNEYERMFAISGTTIG